ncbi:Rpn family recombination-promoting nuclease/putative transposase [Rudanella paleaurantiibacter]|uniref:Rpn family recombination-promoting nuclease/putative transposase n=1 Tax=Rudanella paleaurantiibacter TaxID=2614655 RepID=A0A7J5TYU7_9BACT|nr:Rpn family recombination-promoting nuclease/putative transposase [Rudanella paleaurantiibacter]KAB7730235.1 Rpn family recombination-promoting nuclease/putative transposase [Rudanella paleaurantiibacter]
METGVYIPIISDYGFKATFGNEADSLFLRTALQALIKSDTPIREVHFDKNAFEALTIDSRSGIFDLACTDENGSQFIVEMQLGLAPHFVQRMKFYALHKFNTVVERGEFDYANLPKIYAIAILAKSILSTAHFHTVANLRSETGEIIDSQLTFITVELAKFNKQVAEIETDLEKLVYTMKTLHTTESTQYPAFWNEEWLKRAIDELDTRKMTPEERAYFARVTAANAEAVKAEKLKIQEAEERKEIAVKTETVKKMLTVSQLSVEDIANFSNTSIDFVLAIKQNLQTGK